MDIAGQMRME